MADRILLFIPMYNCEKQVTRVLNQIDAEVAQFVTECVVINNRSTDSGEQVVSDYLNNTDVKVPVKLLRNDENYGLGGSHKVAFDYAINNNMDYVICLHGDDQGAIKDFLPALKSGDYRKYDCFLGARFMKGAKLMGYSKIRIWGNYVFNWLFSIVVRKKVYDLGSGLNMYKVEPLKNKYYEKFPDTLYFNDCMILAYVYYNMNMHFEPITWREEDQVSNNKLIKFSISLLKMLGSYTKDKKRYMTSEMREKTIDNYTAQIVAQK